MQLLFLQAHLYSTWQYTLTHTPDLELIFMFLCFTISLQFHIEVEANSSIGTIYPTMEITNKVNNQLIMSTISWLFWHYFKIFSMDSLHIFVCYVICCFGLWCLHNSFRKNSCCACLSTIPYYFLLLNAGLFKSMVSGSSQKGWWTHCKVLSGERNHKGCFWPRWLPIPWPSPSNCWCS